MVLKYTGVYPFNRQIALDKHKNDAPIVPVTDNGKPSDDNGDDSALYL